MLSWINWNFRGKHLCCSLQQRLPSILLLNRTLLQKLREKCMWIHIHSRLSSNSPVLRKYLASFKKWPTTFFITFFLSGKGRKMKEKILFFFKDYIIVLKKVIRWCVSSNYWSIVRKSIAANEIALKFIRWSPDKRCVKMHRESGIFLFT